MTVELDSEEAAILIAVMTFAEAAALDINPAVTEALGVLRGFRSRLLESWLRDRMTVSYGE